MILHFWELPGNRNYIVLKKKFRAGILNILENKKYSWKIIDKIRNGKISIENIKIISKKEGIPLDIIEQNILWIGGNNSKGISNPKFSINLLTKSAVRFIAAIVNDGTLTRENENSYGRLMYDNFDESLRNSVLRDCINTFGGQTKEIAFRNSEKKRYLEFPSITRDIVELILIHKGPKTESNYNLPNFILKDKNLMLAWIEQTIADEGEVKYYPNKYRRAIVWRRSVDITPICKNIPDKEIPLRKLSKEFQGILQKQKCNFINDEEKMLNLLGIKYKIYNLGIYPTTKNKVRTRWQISITKRENLLKLRELIRIPSEIKDKKFTDITKEFVRYKEPLNILEQVKKLGKEKKVFTSIDLKKNMNYKTTNTANKWMNLFEKKGFIKKIKKSSYGNGSYRNPAEYKLIPDK